MPLEERRLTNRKTFSTIKEPIRKQKVSPILLWISIGLICFIICLSLCEMENDAKPKIYQVDFHKNSSGIHEEMLEIDLSFIYLNKYCKDHNEVKCKEDEMLMLDHLIQMLTSNNDEEQLLMLPNYKQQESMMSFSNSEKFEGLDEYTLEAVTNSKLTTPKTKEKTFFNVISSIFLPEDPYEGLSSIFSEEGKEWTIQTEYPVLTVKAWHRQIVPHFLEIESLSKNDEHVYLIGLTLTLSKELFALKLGKYQLKPGVNLIECLSDNCHRDFSMILMKFSRMKLKRIKIYQKKIS